MRPGLAPLPGEQPPAQADAKALSRAIGLLPAILELCESSPLHCLHPVGVLFDRIFQSLLNRQYRLLARNGKPVAFVNWAWLSPALAAQFEQDHVTFKPEEWRSGPELWFCEIVVREGMMPVLIRDLQHGVFAPGTRARWLRIGPSGEVQGVGEVRMPGPAVQEGRETR
jgi:cytolysin-activating lysine-acyltransferase